MLFRYFENHTKLKVLLKNNNFNKSKCIYYVHITGNYGQTKKRNSELKFDYSALVEDLY